MPANVVKTERDEHLWEEAKKAAEDEERAEDYPYIMGIYKKMKGIAKSWFPVMLLADSRRVYLRMARVA